MTYEAGQLLWAVAKPGTLLLALVLVAGIALAAGRRRLAGLALAVAATLAGALGLTPLDRWLLAPLEMRFQRPAALPAQVDGILVLGGGISVRTAGAGPTAGLNAAGARAIAAAILARRYPQARLVYASGAAWPPADPVTEARRAADLLRALGLEANRVVTEERSHNTRENALFAKEAVDPQAGETWLLVTSAFHMPRAVGVFRAVGWPGLVPYPVDWRIPTVGPASGWLDGDLTGGLARADTALKEYVGLVGYRLIGWTAELFPSPARGS